MRFATQRYFDKEDVIFDWVGEPDENDPPGNIEPDRIIAIGYQGDGTDSEVLLDYSVSSDTPRVLAGHRCSSRERIRPTPDWSGYWGPHFREVAPDISAFVDVLTNEAAI